MTAVECAAEKVCPLCRHKWVRHDPDDGCCDALGDELGVCPCGRDAAFMRVRIAALSRASLGDVEAAAWEALREEGGKGAR